MAGYAGTDYSAPTADAFSEKILNRLARKIGDEWRDIACELDFKDQEIQQIKAQVPQTETNYLVAVTFQILKKWRSRNEHLSDEEKYNMLRRAFQEIEKQSLVYQLDQLVDISSIKEAGNKQVRLEREVETLRQELEALKAQSDRKSHQQNDNYKKDMEDLKRSLILKMDEQHAQEQKDKQRHRQEVGLLQKQLQDATDNKQHQQPSAIQDKTVKSKQAPVSSISLATLLSSAYKSVKEVTLSDFPQSLKIVRGELWSCHSNGITIYDLQLDTKRHLKCAGMGTIHGVAELEDCVVTAADNGLFTTSLRGENKNKVTSGIFTDVCYANGSVYAAIWSDSQIHVYNPRDWTRTRIIKTGCGHGYRGHSHTLSVTSKHIALACQLDHCIYNIDVSGEIISKQGKRGVAIGQFNAQRVCQSDSNNALLVADCVNHRLQLLHENAWHVLQLQPQPQPEQLRGAVYVHGALYVVDIRVGICPFKLKKYEPTK